MKDSSAAGHSACRSRFIRRATLGYAVFALVWIFFSDRLLSAFADLEAIARWSSLKGGLFVAVTAALLYFLLHTVPDGEEPRTGGSFLETMVAPPAGSRWRPWLIYAFAAGVSVATLALRLSIPVPYGQRPFLILFMLPIIFSALLGGLGPGLLATAVAAGGLYFGIMPPPGAFKVPVPSDLLQWALLVACGLVVSALSQALRRALVRAEAQRRLLEAVVAGSQDAIFIKDRAGRYVLCNDSAARFVDLPVAAILGRDDRAVFAPEVAAALMAREQAVMAAGKTGFHEETVTTRSGRVFTFFTNKGPVIDEAGRVVGLFGISRDITEQRAAQEQIRCLNADLERRVAERTAQLSAANQELQMFASAVSHDLKAPLRAINGFSGLLESHYGDRLGEEGRHFLDAIRHGAARMGALIDDLLAYARINQGEAHVRPVDLGAAVEEAMAERRHDFQARAARLRLECSPATVLANADGLAQVLRNLLDNALKYAAPGRPLEVLIGGEIRGERYCLWVRDNGIGFDIAHHDRIFEIFQRLHSYREYAGTGVGLALVRKAMERMGGRVWAESAPGQGATFYVELPLATSARGAGGGE